MRVYIYIYIHVHIYIYIYIHILNQLIIHYLSSPGANRPRARGAEGRPRCATIGKGQVGSALMGITALVYVLFDRGTFGVLPFTYFYIPKSARAYLVPQSVNINHFSLLPRPH